MMSRVVPAWGDTIAAGRLARRFTMLDFPTFTGPATATVSPSRNRSPRWESAKRLRISRSSSFAIANAGPITQQSFELLKSLASLCFRFRPYQIRQALHSGEIEFSILESPPREFPRPGRPESFDCAERREHCCNYGLPSMKLKFSCILAGFASRAWKPQDHGIID